MTTKDRPASSQIATANSFEELKAQALTFTSLAYITVEDKSKLVGIPFIVQSWELADSKSYKDTTKVTLHCVSENMTPFDIVDHGVGILNMLKSLPEENKDMPIYCPQGLRKSEYTNEHGKATTFYL